MSELIFIFLLLLFPGLAHCFPVTANQAGNRPSQLFFCKTPGCAAEVTAVFCAEKLLLYNSSIESCTAPPPPGTVCQRSGLAFVATNTIGGCEFEGDVGHIQTEKCKGNSDICVFPIAITASPAPIKDHAASGYIAAGVCVSVLVTIGLSLYFWKKKRTAERQQASDSGVTVAMRLMQSPGETDERCTDGGGSGPDNSCSPSQHDHGA